MRSFQKIRNTAYDAIVIGGGVNGAATARDAALRGLKTIVVEKADFAGGTSSWSTRLVHGGLRYLEYFEFSLVRESLHERELLLRCAPHLVKPLMLTVPIYGDRSRPYWKIWAGMILYDFFSFDKSMLPHRMLPKQKFRQHLRSLDPDGLKGGAQYYDAQVVYAERLCLENIIAAREAGATVLNYVEVIALERNGDRITRLHCRDVFTGEVVVITGSQDAVVINTAGPWVDEICRRGVQAGGECVELAREQLIGGTKGSHIIVDAFPGAPDMALYVEAKSDKRPFFIVPWLGSYLIGTTDIRFNGNLEQIKAGDEEIDYLLRETNLTIPSARLTRDDVKFTYSGVRPLPNTEGKPGGITRRHLLHDHGKEGTVNLISLVGGKLTTFRHVGEQLTDAIFLKMGRPIPPCPTLHQPFPGAILPNDPRIADAIVQYGDRLKRTTVDRLFDLYGARALQVLALVDDAPELGECIVPEMPDIKAQVVYAVRAEFAQTAADIARRRTPIAMEQNYGLDALPVLLDVLQRHCGWSQKRCDRSRTEYINYVVENCIPDYVLAQLQTAEKLEIAGRSRP
ncbi:glycerol-3-phosphate dehydrogenase [Rubidibacter lacunae KORDI 51-2]|uniref:Glycerol-3-phosphate dehydrogenase n=1 Tax=Rubidibacter lacunae KORDI 51-2 TaxID=582515 RepID=U5DLV9_9CHRO|nr:glycerol-3-phosphate dehydrogenase/oxidase [Rubidibacter lacunae]ERN40695.1 glycerol-3-phosphate dehydrogenase [Rubidibacter lacunae KORDI 51-2]